MKIGTTQAQRKLFFKLGQAKKQLETISKRNPEFGEIAESLGVKDTEVAEMDLRMGSRDLSLNELVSDDGDSSHLDFLTQELNREINTISSKASDSLISMRAVEVKAELEKLREQIQNVE